MRLERGSLVKSMCCSSKVSKFYSQHPRDQVTETQRSWVAMKPLLILLIIKALFEICTIFLT